MKCPRKGKIAAITIVSVSLLILTSFALCNPSYSEYKIRVLVNTVEIKINCSEDSLQTEAEEPEEGLFTEVVEEASVEQ